MSKGTKLTWYKRVLYPGSETASKDLTISTILLLCMVDFFRVTALNPENKRFTIFSNSFHLMKPFRTLLISTCFLYIFSFLSFPEHFSTEISFKLLQGSFSRRTTSILDAVKRKGFVKCTQKTPGPKLPMNTTG